MFSTIVAYIFCRYTEGYANNLTFLTIKALNHNSLLKLEKWLPSLYSYDVIIFVLVISGCRTYCS